MAIEAGNQPITTDAEVVIKEPEDTGDDDTQDDGSQDAATSTDTESTPRAPTGQFQKRPGGTRRDRRAAFESQAKQIEDRVSSRVRAEMEQFQNRFQQMLGNQQRPAAPAPAAAPAQNDNLAMLETALQSEIAAAQNHDRSKGAYDFTRYNQIQARIQSARAEQATLQTLQRMGLTPEALRRMNQPQRETFGREAQYTSRYYTLVNDFPFLSNPDHAKSVGAYRNYLINGLGRPDTIDTDREAAAHIAAQKGLGGKLPRGNEARYAGMRSGEGGVERAPREIRLPAGAMNHLDDDEQRRIRAALFAPET